jgi:chemotaxis protein methyltransferase CheR
MNPFVTTAPRPRLRPEEFRLLRDLINEYAGLQFDDDAAYAFDRRLGERVATLELGGFDDYYKYLRFDQRGRAELEEAVEHLIIGETYFFRQEYQLRGFRDEILPVLQHTNRAGHRLTVWSAGCSTGEEAYTIAMLIHESCLFPGWEVRVIGSDLSRRNVAAARRGIYRASSFRTTAPEATSSYFEPAGEGLRVVDWIRKVCHFGQLNLVDRSRSAIVGRVDVIFCRNVLIYFDLLTRRRVIDSLYERLVPGGYLLLGHSESLLNVSTAFELVHLKEDLVYRKPQAAERWDGAKP